MISYGKIKPAPLDTVHNRQERHPGNHQSGSRKKLGTRNRFPLSCGRPVSCPVSVQNLFQDMNEVVEQIKDNENKFWNVKKDKRSAYEMEILQEIRRMNVITQ